MTNLISIILKAIARSYNEILFRAQKDGHIVKAQVFEHYDAESKTLHVDSIVQPKIPARYINIKIGYKNKPTDGKNN